MKSLTSWRTVACVVSAVLSVPALALAQELPFSGSTGFDYFYATSPTGTSQFFAVNIHRSLSPFVIGPPVANEPSTWAHRRRTLGALETNLVSPARGLWVTPMGNGVGTGALHMIDMRTSGVQSALVPTGNPAGYDLAYVNSMKFLFTAEDDGAGNTLLRGFSYATFGTLTPLTPPTLTIPGSPSAYVNRIGVDLVGHELHVPTVSGVQVVLLDAAAPQMVAGPFVSTGATSPTTNPFLFNRNGQLSWIIGTSTFNPSNPLQLLAAGYLVWDSSGASSADEFGVVPTAPSKKWVPAVGAEELAVVGNGTDTYAYSLLREPAPGTFFVKPSAVGVVRLVGSSAPVTSTILMPTTVGEPFGVPTTFGGRVAFEGSFGLPFTISPPGGGEVVAIIYSPIDPLGASNPDGVLGVPDPLGGRISTKGMDRPIWSADGRRVMAATSHFPGAPNPATPGIEVLDVPTDIVVDEFVSSHTVVHNNPFPNQSIIYPTLFRPRTPAAAAPFLGITFFGNVFNGGMASIAAPAWGEVGQYQVQPGGFFQSPFVPDFPSILPPSFKDATGSLVSVPLRFGARRTAFNYPTNLGFTGMCMAAAIDDHIFVQPSGINFLAALGLAIPADPIAVALPAGWVTTTEFYSF